MLSGNPASRPAGQMSFKCELLFSSVCSLNKTLTCTQNWLVIIRKGDATPTTPQVSEQSSASSFPRQSSVIQFRQGTCSRCPGAAVPPSLILSPTVEYKQAVDSSLAVRNLLTLGGGSWEGGPPLPPPRQPLAARHAPHPMTHLNHTCYFQPAPSGSKNSNCKHCVPWQVTFQDTAQEGQVWVPIVQGR